ncbi:hypothetical protein CVIRNUC_009793 [Coccomyxa viridis]|uniref:Uncharacterized protein n=1 Tax=Coccomyxa viridis TaxID=1274662 RepID=A0AAV1IHL1_9CHLO|nr:hypothetical protein CVIRNUC_009793 [Coccomyxa viridis]
MPPSPPPAPPGPPGPGTVPWQGTLQGITSALGIVLAAFIIGVLISFSRVCCSQRTNSGPGFAITGIPAISSSGIVQPPIAPVAAAQPPPPPPAPRKAVELVLVQNPGDDVCFAKHDEPGPDGRPRPQPASR